MKNDLLAFDSKKENTRIVSFLKKTFAEQKIENAVIGLSGGIDSTVSFYLLKQVLAPKNIFPAHLYYEKPIYSEIEKILQETKIPKKNILYISIKPMVDALAKELGVGTDKIRRGNIAARLRMITLFDLAKKHQALVMGTENKTENLLSYFTRYGDQASDIEPIEHLYKTQVYQLAEFLGVPQIISQQKPTAGLWAGQTDEGEFGFSYEEADHVLFLALEKKYTGKQIIKMGYPNADKILAWRERYLFKHNVPYTLHGEE